MGKSGTDGEELRQAIRALQVAERRLADLHDAEAPDAEIEKAESHVREARAAFERAVSNLPPG